MHTTTKRITHCKLNSRTLQTKHQHAANKNSCTLQTKLQHTANKTPARCKQNSSTLQTKLPHTANKTPARCKQKQKVLRAQDDVKDWDLVSSRGCHENSDPCNVFFFFFKGLVNSSQF